jgi:GNAT superfamily N-acetyltransferase
MIIGMKNQTPESREKGDKRRLTVHPLTPDRLPDFEKLFGPRGACGGCFCMWWRLPRPEFNRQKGEGNRKAMRALVESGAVPGLLAYEGEAQCPVGWCSVSPRAQFPTLGRSRILRPVDGKEVWSVVCFFVAKTHRRKNLTVELLRAAVGYVRDQGGTIVEGYPIEPSPGKSPLPAPFAYTGIASAFRQAGFRECARRSPTRPIMRFTL